jgi:hypothetical protein
MWPFACSTILVLSVKLPNLKLKTQPKQLLGSLPLVIALSLLSVTLSLSFSTFYSHLFILFTCSSVYLFFLFFSITFSPLFHFSLSLSHTYLCIQSQSISMDTNRSSTQTPCPPFSPSLSTGNTERYQPGDTKMIRL